jgi:hypothetical protein
MTTQQRQFQWHFIPPNSPHFGGLWKAGIEPLKYHWKRIVSKVLLTFEEFSTLIMQIEACLNSPLHTALSNDPSYLSPGHFLIGTLLTSLPEPDFTNATMNSLSKWQRVLCFNQQLWILQLTTMQQMVQLATRPPAQYACPAS